MTTYNNNSNQDIIDQMIKLQERVETLEKANPLNNGTVDEGGITVKSGGDVIVQDGGHVIARNSADPGSKRVVLGWQQEGDIPYEGEFYPDPQLLFYLGTQLEGLAGATENGDIFMSGRIGMNLTVSGFGEDEADVSGLLMSTGDYEFGDGTHLVNLISANDIWLQAGVDALDDPNPGHINLECAYVNGFVRSATTYEHTTGIAANMYIHTDGSFWRSTSSLKYKQDVVDAELDVEAILQLRPRVWRDKSEVEIDPDTDHMNIGFIAEEVHDLGLTQFVTYDAEGNPDALQYDRFAAALITVIKEMHHDIQELKEANNGTA